MVNPNDKSLRKHATPEVQFTSNSASAACTQAASVESPEGVEDIVLSLRKTSTVHVTLETQVTSHLIRYV